MDEEKNSNGVNKTIIIFIIALLAVGGGAFYGGMKYSQSKTGNSNFQSMQNLTPEQRQQRLQQLGTGTGANRTGRNGAAGNDFTSGDIIAKDDKSVTIKLPDGGSKIIFLSASTQISQFTQASSTELAIGKQISVNGSANSDGSITAQSIQLRPASTTPIN